MTFKALLGSLSYGFLRNSHAFIEIYERNHSKIMCYLGSPRADLKKNEFSVTINDEFLIFLQENDP